MLAYALLILVTLLISAAAIWLWRLVSSHHGLERSSLVNPARKTRKKLKTRQGFISATKRSSKAYTKTPWGW